MKQKLLTQEIIRKLPPLGSTDGMPHDQRKIIVKFFHPYGHGTWFVLEGSKTPEGDYEFFGLVHLFEEELGYFTLSELESVKGPCGAQGIERDAHYGDHTLADVENKLSMAL